MVRPAAKREAVAYLREHFQMSELGGVQILSHIFSSDSGFGLGFLGLKQWPHVHVALR